MADTHTEREGVRGEETKEVRCETARRNTCKVCSVGGAGGCWRVGVGVDVDVGVGERGRGAVWACVHSCVGGVGGWVWCGWG